jgi:hypothetical protein
MERGRPASDDHDTPPAREGESSMHAVPPEGPLGRDDRDEPDWLDEPETKPNVDRGRERRGSLGPTLLLLAAVALIVALILLL